MKDLDISILMFKPCIQVFEEYLLPAVYTFNMYKRGLMTAFGDILPQQLDSEIVLGTLALTPPHTHLLYQWTLACLLNLSITLASHKFLDIV